MKKYVLLLFILVLAAGCVGRQVKVEANNGLKLEEFSADPKVAEFNDNVLFAVGVENVGGTTAKTVELKLFSIENIWRKQASEQLAGSQDIVHNFNNEQFEPPFPQQNRPGDLKIFTKTFRPPILPEGVEQDFPITARVTFDYSTSGSIIVPTISKSLLRIKTDKGEAVESTPRISNSNGPLKIGLSKGTLPIVVDETRTGEQEATFVIEFLNVGDGFPVTEVTGQERARTLGLLQGSITLFGLGVRFDERDGCLGIVPTSPTKIDFTAANIDLLKLRSNGRLPLSCTIKIQRNAFTPTTSGIVTFSMSMNYKYFIEKTLNVHVIGTKEATQPLAGATPAATATPTATPSTALTLSASKTNPAINELVTLTAAATNVPNGYLIATYRDGSRLSNTCGQNLCQNQETSDSAISRTYVAKVEGHIPAQTLGTVLATSNAVTITWGSPDGTLSE